MKFETHADYDKYLPKWTRCRDASSGQDEVRAKKTAYLPKPSEFWTDPEYNSYLAHADYFNATGRTVDLFAGLIFRRPPVIEAPPGMDNFIQDATQKGQSLEQVARRCVQEDLTVGRIGVLVDYPAAAEGEALTAAEVEARNLRPRLALYTAEALENWAQEWRLNRYVTTYVQLAESATVKRILILDPENVYRVQTWADDKGRGEWVLTGETVPLMNGTPLNFIPFFVADPVDSTLSVDNPPLLDLVNINLSHYRTMADLELGRQKTALPTFWATGIQADDSGEPFRLGAGNALVATNPDARFGLLEFTGQGLGALETADKDKRDMMSRLGAKMLADNPGEESGEAKQIDKAGEDSVLASIANAVSAALTRCMEIARDWYGISGEVSIQLNTRYYQKTANPQELVAMIGAVQAGTLSLATLWGYMQERDIVDRQKSLDELREEVDNDAQSLTAGLNLLLPGQAQGQGQAGA